jgi:hypothetical protein
LAAPFSAGASARTQGVRIPKDWRLRASPTIELLAPEVGFVGASRSVLVTYDDFFPDCRDNFFMLSDCPNEDIQNSLLTVSLTVF